MIKAFAVTLLIAVMGSSISEFILSPEESFTLHFENDYIFTLSECGPACISLGVSQEIDGKTTWTGQLFDLHEGRMYPVQMKFEDVVFDSVYVASIGDVVTLRVSYREVNPVVSNQRLVKAASEKETVETVSFLIVLELGAVIFLIFFAAHKILQRKSVTPRTEDIPEIPGPVVGFHQEYPQMGIPRDEEDPDLQLLQRIREIEALKEMEIQKRMRRRLDEEDALGLDWI